MAKDRITGMRQIGIGITAAAALLLLLPFFARLYSERNLMMQEAALIGRIHEKLPEEEGTILELLYDTEITKTDIQAGREVLLKHGYTAEGLPILIERLSAKGESIVLFLAAAAVVAVLFFFLVKLKGEFRAERHEAEEEKRRLEKELSEIPELRLKNRRLGEFVENIAHQIKTPLSRVMTSVEILSDSLPEDKRDRTAECMNHLMDVRKLVDRVLEIGRMEAGEVLFHAEPFSLKELSEELIAEQAADARPVLKTTPESGSFLYRGSAEWIREALANLLDNISRYASSGSGADVSDPPLLALEEMPEAYRITLRDYGPGFSEEDLPYLFDRFYRTKDMKKGHVGLGLNLVRLIIEGHKGRITAENHPDGGAQVTVLLPRYSLMK